MCKELLLFVAILLCDSECCNSWPLSWKNVSILGLSLGGIPGPSLGPPLLGVIPGPSLGLLHGLLLGPMLGHSVGMSECCNFVILGLWLGASLGGLLGHSVAIAGCGSGAMSGCIAWIVSVIQPIVNPLCCHRLSALDTLCLKS